MWIDHWREILNLNLTAFNEKLQAHITDLKGKRFIPTLDTMSSPHILPADKVVVWFTSLSMNKVNETFTLKNSDGKSLLRENKEYFFEGGGGAGGPTFLPSENLDLVWVSGDSC